MSIHYDVEKTVASIKANVEGHKLAKGSPRSAILMHRNHDVTYAFARMFMTELNRGSSIIDLLEVTKEFVANAVHNILSPIDNEEVQLSAVRDFSSSLTSTLERRILGKSGIVSAGMIEMSVDEGGNA